MLVSVSSRAGTIACFLYDFLLFRVLCVKYLTSIREKVFISLWILELGSCRSWRSLKYVVCVMPLILTMNIIGCSTIHPSWDRSGWRVAYLSSIWLLPSTEILSLQ